MMDKNTHTPGPWWVDETVLWRIRCNPTPQVDTGTTVCEMCSDRTIAETAANARLIAAAPELLEALLAAEIALACYYPQADEPGRTHPAMIQVRAAVRAARGEATR